MGELTKAVICVLCVYIVQHLRETAWIRKEICSMPLIEVKSSEARKNFRDLLDNVMTGDSDIMILRNGKQIAAIIPADDYTDIREELEDLRLSRIADEAYDEYLADKEAAIPYDEFSADLISAGEEHA